MPDQRYLSFEQIVALLKKINADLPKGVEAVWETGGPGEAGGVKYIPVYDHA